MHSPRPWTLPLLFCVLAVWVAAAPRAGAGTPPIVVTTTADSGRGTLREAIIIANQQAGFDTIAFDIKRPGAQTISPTTSLPAIIDPVLIDGYTQPGSRPNTLSNGSNAVLMIEVEGSLAGPASGLDIAAGNSGVRGLVLNRWQNAAVSIRTTGGNVIEGNFIGTDVTGTGAGFALNNSLGVFIQLAPNNRIGGTIPAERNVISGSRGSGVLIIGGRAAGAGGNVIQGNYIGTDKNGAAAIGNVAAGINIDGAPDTVIGGTNLAARNLISGNGTGIVINNAGAARTIIRGNYIGTDFTGGVDLGNAGRGIFVQSAPNTTIGGMAPTAGAPPGNLISGNQGDGIDIFVGSGTFIEGNLIGTDETGSVDLGNGGSGVVLTGSARNTVGGAVVDARNVISGNDGSGVVINPAGAVFDLNAVQGNFIGTDAAGTAPLGNAGFGITINGGGNAIGGAPELANRGNTIAFNGAAGVQVTTTGSFNPILGNSIFSNAGLGIDLDQSGVTPNDPGDGDTGGNDRQNFPVLLSAISAAGTTTVQGTLDSRIGRSYRLEFFSSPAPDPTGFGEGRTYLGTMDVFVPAPGATPFTAVLPGTLPGDTVVTATATDPTGNTSEFSRAVVIQSNRPPVVTNPGDQTSNTGDTVVLVITATDPDGDALTYSASGLPPGLTINPVTGVISGTVSLNFAGVTRVTVTASDGRLTGSTSFDWRVLDNRAPTVSNCTVSPRTLPVSGGTVRIGLNAVDNIGIQRATALIVLPNGQITSTTLDPAGGTRYTGDILVPANSTVNDQVYGVRVSVRDAAGNSSATLDCGSFTVAPTGPGPRLRLSPASQRVDFGRGRVGTVGRRRVTVRNGGTGTLRGIIGTLGAPFRVSREDGVPPDPGGVFAYSLRAGQSLSLVVRAAPTRTGVYTDRFRVTSSDPDRRNAYMSVRAEGCRN